ncbi:MAG TPA: hypothetical protein VNG12_05415 [Acidimicrobiales bacterium]|nr:hypothetical protein [Acidimicrobiales bacterium]
MVSATQTKRVLAALAEALPDDGRNLITRVDVSRMWGDAVQVKIFTSASIHHEPRELRPLFQKAVDDALGEERHLLSVEWDYRR